MKQEDKYYVIGGECVPYCYGSAPTLLEAKRLAEENEEYWSNWQGWHIPAIYAAEDVEWAEETFFSPCGDWVPKSFTQPVAEATRLEVDDLETDESEEDGIAWQITDWGKNNYGLDKNHEPSGNTEHWEWHFENGYVVKEISNIGSEIIWDNGFCYSTVHALEVYNKEKFLGTVYPANNLSLEGCIKALDSGEDPVTGGWEDCCGHPCNEEGWPDYELEPEL